MTTIYVDDKSTLPKRSPSDYYPTPQELADSAVRKLPTVFPEHSVLDIGAGTGVWGKAYRKINPPAWIVGYEIQPEFVKPPEYDAWVSADFLDVQQIPAYRFVIGNPPYSLAEEFVRHGMGFLQDGGEMMLLLRLEFLASQRRRKDLFARYPPSHVHICSRRPSFNGTTKTAPNEYALFRWVKWQRTRTTLDFWDYKEDQAI